MNKEQKAAKKTAKKNKRRKAIVKHRNQTKAARARFMKAIRASRRMAIAKRLKAVADTKVSTKELTNKPDSEEKGTAANV